VVEYILPASILVLCYVYFGYYLVLRCTAGVYNRKTTVMEGHTPRVSVIVAAYNEEAAMAGRIENLLGQEYPMDKMEIIVASDGSRDRTADIARGFADRGVRVLDFSENRGKAWVHNDSVKAASGEIILFTDAETRFNNEAVRNIVRHYADPAVGSVTGRLVLVGAGDGVSDSEGLYFRYENLLRSLEGRLGVLATGTGACISVRKELYRPLGGIDDSDFVTPIDCVKAGRLVRFEPEAVATDHPPRNPASEFRMRVRMTSRNFLGTVKRCGAGFVFTSPLFAFCLLSHKFLRWFTGFFLLAALASNLVLAGNGPAYGFLLGCQAVFYGLAFAGWIGGRGGRSIPVASQIFSFVLASAGMCVGVVNGVLGRVPVKWKMEVPA